MTVQEFSHEFDVLYNNITNGVAPGVNEYEKSVFLTRAQYQFVQDILIGNTTTGDSADSSTITKSQLQPLYESAIVLFLPDNQDNYPSDVLHLLSTYLELNVPNSEGIKIPVLPVSYDDLNNIINNPFYSSKRKAYMVQTKDNTYNIYYQGQLVKNINYALHINYIRNPKPILLCNLEDDFEIDGHFEEQTSELPEFTHFEILKRAIQMALVANGVANS